VAKEETSIPPRPAALAATRNAEPPTPQRKKALFGGGKTNTKLTISRPIMQEDASQNLMNRIPVMDLKDAAVAEKERRERRGDLGLGIVPSKTPTSAMSPEEGVQRATSIKRKQVGSPPSRQSMFPGALRPEDVGTAMTTSAQRSPGGEEARRRSPRLSSNDEQQSITTFTVDTNRLTIAQTAVFTKPDIRPSRTLPPSPPPAPQEPAKTPLQRRPTIGLPQNPRARGVQVPQESGSRTKTILFVNNIEYNDPMVVQSIIKDVSQKAPKAPPASAPVPAPAPATAPITSTAYNTKPAKANPIPPTPGTSDSIINRPRPIPRKKDVDSPAKFSPRQSHRRSKSAGALVARSILSSSTPGSPSQLPPLPPLPPSTVVPPRPHPNDTRSMTVEEKITLLFPSPPSGKVTRRRSSSVPEVPSIPKSPIDIPSPVDSERRTTKTSVRTESVLEVDEIPRKSATTLLKTAGEAAASSWLEAFDAKEKPAIPKSTAAQDGGKRKSSPVLPGTTLPPRVSAWATTTVMTEDDATTNWSAVQSPEFAVGVPVIKNIGPPAGLRGSDGGAVAAEDDARRSETLPIMLDASTVPVEDIKGEEGEQPAPQSQARKSPEQAQYQPARWHRRVGDECPTFSTRKENRRSRKLSPPPPLTLKATTTARHKITIQVEPSPPSPVESPEKAIQELRERLRKLEEFDRNSPGSAARRLALLESLEKEVGEQVEHLEEIRHDIERDSISSISTTSISATASQRSSLRDSLALQSSSRRASRLSRVMRLREEDRMERSSNRDSGSPQMSRWQKRLTEVQMEYMDVQLLRTSTVSFLQVARAQLTSPTPPDSDSDQGEPEPVPPIPDKFKQSAEHLQKEEPKKAALLWTPPVKESERPLGLLWTPPARKSAPAEDVTLPGLTLRPALRKDFEPLRIESSQLWHKPCQIPSRPSSGLWRPIWASAAPPAEPVRSIKSSPQTTTQEQQPQQQEQKQDPPKQQQKPRPSTLRPPRRTKRITMLPDILESPEPLPDRRDTLGIFQFPWGERSDTATLPPRPVAGMSMGFTAMPGTMTTGGLGMAPATHMQMQMQMQAASTGFTAPPAPAVSAIEQYGESFFDDYDDDAFLDEMPSNSEDEDDDSAEFDDSTLWEIANLLRTDAVPSRDSLFPLPESTAFGDAEQGEESEEENSPRAQSILIGLDEAPQALSLPEPPPNRTSSATVTVMMVEESTPSDPKQPVRRPSIIGLPVNPKANLQAVQAQSLPTSESQAQFTSSAPEPAALTVSAGQGSAGLWVPPEEKFKKVSSQGHQGLFVPPSPGSKDKSKPVVVDAEPAAKNVVVIRKPRSVVADLTPLESSSLWTPCVSEKKVERNWIVFSTRTSSSSSPSLGLVGLWSPPKKVKETASVTGLFVPGSVLFRGTDQEPIAKDLARKVRPVEDRPLDRLTSTSLWSPTAVVKKVEHDWISELPRGLPGLWLTPSKVKEVKSANGLFVPGSVKHRGTAAEPIAKETPRKPRAVDTKPLEKITSADLWTPKQTSKDIVGKNWIFHSTTRRFRRPLATDADWTAALNEALKASYPQKKLRRTVANPAQWQAALQEALSLSYPQKQTEPFDAATRHPVFAARSLVTRSPWFHPAATGYTYDVAAVHPVFFGSLDISSVQLVNEDEELSVEAVHPAIASYAARKIRRQRRRERKELSRSRSRSGSGSSSEKESSKSKHKKERSTTETVVLPPVSADIQARIEALEQERQFIERAAREEYRRRTSMMSQTAVQAPLPVVEAVPSPSFSPAGTTSVIPAATEAVEALQRRLSLHIRQSLAFAKPTKVEVAKPAKVEIIKSRSKAREPVKLQEKKPTQPAQLWTPPKPTTAALPKTSTTTPTAGLWSPNADHSPSVAFPSEEEDAFAKQSRAHRRKLLQKRQRRVEILAQIAAIEQGVNPFVENSDEWRMQGLWTNGFGGAVREKERGWGREWILMGGKKARGVVLRY